MPNELNMPTFKKHAQMTTDQLFEQIQQKKTFLCVGLDTDIKRIPVHLLNTPDPIFAFNKAIIDATSPFCIAFKPNIAFYECHGAEGWISLQKTVRYIRENYPDQFIIADAKRGDIGNTSSMYAHTFFDSMDFDAVTLAPYMGKDSIAPFLLYPNKFVILLALTSNPSAKDFQTVTTATGESLFELVLRTASTWTNDKQMMFVVGATQAKLLAHIRTIIPEHFLLIPGIGTQGGDLNEVCSFGLNKTCGLIVNSSRAIIYADSSTLFAEGAANAAQSVQIQMQQQLKIKHLI